jgi:hypothetical protein
MVVFLENTVQEKEILHAYNAMLGLTPLDQVSIQDALSVLQEPTAVLSDYLPCPPP